MEGPGDLEILLADGLRRSGVPGRGDRVVVAVSGGMDSVVLLHLLRFSSLLAPVELVAAHFDHRMREGSRGDALWVRGLCRAWDVPFVPGVAAPPPSSEEEAREARYDFLLETKRAENARWIVTAHHADDQAETVLFRILRGTGLRGLKGIPAHRAPGILRPLLPFSRAMIRRYARERRLGFRVDPSNRDPAFSRNVLRHDILPRLERGPAPGAREALRRLARLARENEEGWSSLLPELLDRVVETESAQEIVVARSALLAYHPAVQARVVRELGRRVGVRLDEAGTRAAVEFTRTGASGGSVPLSGGFRLAREFDRFRLAPASDEAEDRPLVVEGTEAGSGLLTVGGRRMRVEWGPEEPGEEPEGTGFGLALRGAGVRFPLRIRSWAPGDRILLPYGTKKLSKLLAEARVPRRERSRLPVVVDAEGRVLAVGDLATSVLIEAGSGPASFFLGFHDVE
jgi:tRNA(Ile)-lysidine synthase